MRRLAAVALLLIGLAIPVCAQRGGSHGGGSHGGGFGGGFSGHSAPAFHGGFRASAPSRFAGTSRGVGISHSAGNGSRGIAPDYWMRGSRNYGHRPPYSGGGHFGDGRSERRRYRPSYRSGIRYGVVPWTGFTGWIGPDYLGYPYDDGTSGYDDSGPYQGNAGGDGYGYDSPPAEQSMEQGPPAPGPYYNQPSAGLPRSESLSTAPAPENAAAVTLVFKDGRASEQIHNYILSRTTLSVLDQHQHDIPVEQLDMVATQKVNRDAGIDFRLPKTVN